MLVSVFLALFRPCAGIGAVLMVYICLLCYASNNDENQLQLHGSPVKACQKKGLSISDLEKLPKVTGKDLVLAKECAICLDEIESDVPGSNHGFHLECADTWLSKNPICPVCRAAIGSDLIKNPLETHPC